MSGALTFVCDRCGALGRAAAAGRARCGACGRITVVEAPFEPGSSDADARASAGPRLPPLAPPSGPDRFERSEIHPEDLPPPEGGYEDLVLDDDGPAAALPAAAPPAPLPETSAFAALPLAPRPEPA
ncbi:MAG TPA: hypothetical protein VLS93_06270, partial [Anaeromyxobacteraceae bacterium]|nr:hypothetical protein [Anaeromyxobacteraceae bacterium]